MFEGVDTWLAFWQVIRFSEVALRIGIPRLLDAADCEDAESLAFLTELDLHFEGFKAKALKDKR